VKNLKWTIGDFTIVPLFEVDAGVVIDEIITDATASSLREIEWLVPNFVEDGHLKAVVQSFLVISDELRLVVDTCVGNDKVREEMPEWNQLHTSFLQRFTEADCPLESVDLVVCTHLHFDHVGWNTQLIEGSWKPTFPRARYIFCEPEYAYWTGNPANEIKDDLEGIQDSVVPIVNAGLADFVPPDAVLRHGITLIPTPGHTPFHVSVLIESNGRQALITGDAFHHPCQIARPSWGTLSDTYIDQARTTRKQIIDRFADTDTLIIGSHFAAPTAGRLRTDGQDVRLDV
jgi:glyoxylase-like metal-dependent hydrolase (beta-lactamase superfamily II)